MAVIARYAGYEVEVLLVNKDLGVSEVAAIGCEPWPVYTHGGWSYSRFGKVMTSQLSDIRVQDECVQDACIGG